MKISFFYVGCSCFIIDIDSKIKIASDPALAPKGTKVQFKSFQTERLKEPVYDKSTFEDIDLWLITHAHQDHLDSEGIAKMNNNHFVLTNIDAIPFLEDKVNKQVMNWQQEFDMNLKGYEIKIKTIPAYHGTNFLMRKLVGRVNGYFLMIKKGDVQKTIYITADTIFHHDVVKSIEISPDIMIANLGEVLPEKFGGPLTMSVSMLNRFVKELNPGLIIPVHIDDFSHYSTSEQSVIELGYSVPRAGKWQKL
jgi:L-ascorbate metabolism protein UlaG (beta-lactamase superfamily)